MLSVSAQDAESRRILDIRLLETGGLYRIVIPLTQLTPYQVVEPAPGQPFRIDIFNAVAEPGLVASPPSNALIQGVVVEASDNGVVRIEAQLASSQVRVRRHTTASPRANIIVDLELRPGVLLNDDVLPEPPPPQTDPPEGVETRTTVSQPAPNVPPPPAPALPRQERDMLALPEVAPGEAAETPPQLTPEMRLRLQEVDYFPIESVYLKYQSGAQELVDAYREKDYLRAHHLGVAALRKLQPRRSLESLVHLVAEVWYQENRLRAMEREDEPTDWPSALNYYQQARLYAPDSPFRAIADHRISQIYAAMGRLTDQGGELERLVDSGRYRAMPNGDEVLFDLGFCRMRLNAESPEAAKDLAEARRRFVQLVEEYPDSSRSPIAMLLIGEIEYLAGDDREAYDFMATASNVLRERRQSVALSRANTIFPDIYAHFALAGHRLGELNIVEPRTPTDRNLGNFVQNSSNPAIRLEYANLLDAASSANPAARRSALVQFGILVDAFSEERHPKEVFEARLALTRYALEDLQNGAHDPSIAYADYADPYRALVDLQNKTFDLRQRAELLREQARYLIDRKRYVDAVRLVLPHLEPGDLPPDIERELRTSVWDIMPQVMSEMYADGDYLSAIRVYDAFGRYLQDHPRRDEILLACAEIMIEAGIRSEAARALEQMSPAANLTPAEEHLRNSIRRELALDPNRPEEIKREAPALLDPSYGPNVRSRVLQMLAETYAAEGAHGYAGQLYAQGLDYEGLTMDRKIEFGRLAAEQFKEASIYNMVTDVLLTSLRRFEESGEPLAGNEPDVGEILMMLGENYERVDDVPKAINAYEQYLQYYPEGPSAFRARFALAQTYEQTGREGLALEHYDRLAAEADGRDAFWVEVGRRNAQLLRWERENAGLAPEGSTP